MTASAVTLGKRIAELLVSAMTVDPLRNQLAAALGQEFAMESELRGGGMSRVFVAHTARLGRRVVVIPDVEGPSRREVMAAGRVPRPQVESILSHVAQAGARPAVLERPQ